MEPIQPTTYSVTELNEHVNHTLEEKIGTILVEGEIVNFKVNRQQWVTFDLKDESSVVNCFASVYKIGSAFENGMTVRLLAKPRIYIPYGKYSLTIEAIQPIGTGSIQQAFKLLIQKLTIDGLFNVEHKKILPKFPEKIGLITSPEGEALHDVRKIFDGRWGGFSTYLYPVHVQGNQAVDEIIQSIHYFNERFPVDVIILTRGGGSMEDLLAFNNEKVARSIFASRIPIVAAIGHERDVTIAELVADMRAATPSHAAQIVVPDWQVISKNLEQITHRTKMSIISSLTTLKQTLEQQAIEQKTLVRLALKNLSTWRLAQQALLSALNPTNILKRGYSFTTDLDSGTIIRSIANANLGQRIQTHLSDGSIYSEVTHANKKII
jgi:exodeoxyribonuclease VII large subunit